MRWYGKTRLATRSQEDAKLLSELREAIGAGRISGVGIRWDALEAALDEGDAEATEFLRAKLSEPSGPRAVEPELAEPVPEGDGRPFPGSPFEGSCYHGSSFELGEWPFAELSDEWSDWEAVWVTPDEGAAREFALNRSGPGRVPVVFKVEVALENMADIGLSGELRDWMEESGCEDVRECIPELHRLGYDGWRTTGSIGRMLYEDIAVFSGRAEVSSASVLVDGAWSEYLPVEEVYERYKEAAEEGEKTEAWAVAKHHLCARTTSRPSCSSSRWSLASSSRSALGKGAADSANAGTSAQVVIQLPDGSWVSRDGSTKDPTQAMAFETYLEATEVAERLGGEIVPVEQMMRVPQTRVQIAPDAEDSLPKPPGHDSVPWPVNF